MCNYLAAVQLNYVNIGIDANGFNVVNVTNANNNYLNCFIDSYFTYANNDYFHHCNDIMIM